MNPQITYDDDWITIHVSPEYPYYYVERSRIKTSKDFDFWEEQLGRRKWYTPKLVEDFIALAQKLISEDAAPPVMTSGELSIAVATYLGWTDIHGGPPVGTHWRGTPPSGGGCKAIPDIDKILQTFYEHGPY